MLCSPPSSVHAARKPGAGRRAAFEEETPPTDAHDPPFGLANGGTVGSSGVTRGRGGAERIQERRGARLGEGRIVDGGG